MICRNCSRLIEACDETSCGIGFVHVSTGAHYCDQPPRHGTNPPRFADPDPEL